jgi:hypothetical protein
MIFVAADFSLRKNSTPQSKDCGYPRPTKFYQTDA